MGITGSKPSGNSFSFAVPGVLKALVCAGFLLSVSACDDNKKVAAVPAEQVQHDVFHAKYKSDRLKWKVKAGSEFVVPLTVENTSEFSWSSVAAHGPVNIAYSWLYVDEEMILRDGARTPLSQDVAPGKSLQVGAMVLAPKERGIYLLRISLVQEGVAWFTNRKVKPLDMTVIVE